MRAPNEPVAAIYMTLAEIEHGLGDDPPKHSRAWTLLQHAKAQVSSVRSGTGPPDMLNVLEDGR